MPQTQYVDLLEGFEIVPAVDMPALTLDKRHYLHVKVFARLYGISDKGAPYKYVYNRGASDGRVFVFRRV